MVIWLVYFSSVFFLVRETKLSEDGYVYTKPLPSMFRSAVYIEQLNSLRGKADFSSLMKVSLFTAFGRSWNLTFVLHQVYFSVLDALPLFLAIVIYVPLWPGKYIEENVSQMNSIPLQNRDPV